MIIMLKETIYCNAESMLHAAFISYGTHDW